MNKRLIHFFGRLSRCPLMDVLGVVDVLWGMENFQMFKDDNEISPCHRIIKQHATSCVFSGQAINLRDRGALH